jgi:translation elongation factor EF-G
MMLNRLETGSTRQVSCGVTTMKFIDAFVEAALKELSSPQRRYEMLISLVVENAVQASSLSERKAWELASSLIATIFKSRSFPSLKELSAIRADINSIHRGSEIRTSDFITSLKMFELGERAVREFLHEGAWDGMPEVDSEGRSLQDPPHGGTLTFGGKVKSRLRGE